MPILNLTDDFAAAHNYGIPRLGKIRKGDMRPEGEQRPGKDLQHFRVTFEPQYQDFESIFTSLYGDEPEVFTDAYLLGNDLNSAFPNWYEERASNRLVHRCDGQTQYQHHDPDTQRQSFVQIACERPACACTERGVLRVMLGKFIQSTGIWGYFQLDTGSIYDIIAIHGYLNFVMQWTGHINGIQFTIGRAMRSIPATVPVKNGGFKKITTEKSLIYLHAAPEFTRTTMLPIFQNSRMSIASGQNELSSDGALSTELDMSTSVHALSSGQFVDSEMDSEIQTDVDTDGVIVDTDTDTHDPFDFSDMPFMRLWDLDALTNSTAHLFNDPVHQMNTIRQLIKDGSLPDDTSTEDAIVILIANRQRRAAEKEAAIAQADDGWAQIALSRKAFHDAAAKGMGLTQAKVIVCINRLNLPHPIRKLEELTGVSKHVAMGACVLTFFNDDISRSIAFAGSNEDFANGVRSASASIELKKAKDKS